MSDYPSSMELRMARVPHRLNYIMSARDEGDWERMFWRDVRQIARALKKNQQRTEIRSLPSRKAGEQAEEEAMTAMPAEPTPQVVALAKTLHDYQGYEDWPEPECTLCIYAARAALACVFDLLAEPSADMLAEATHHAKFIDQYKAMLAAARREWLKEGGDG